MRLDKVTELLEDKLVKARKAPSQEIDAAQCREHEATEPENLGVGEVGEVEHQDQEASAYVEGDSTPFEGAYGISVQLACIWAWFGHYP